jgi:hypothetical protein
MKRFSATVALILLAVAASGAALAQSNPFVGTWKLNTAKSKFGLGPGPQNLTQTYEAQGDGVKVSTEGTAADGSSIGWSYTASYDGKDNPIIGTGVPDGADTIAIKRINEHTTSSSLKKGGAVVRTARAVVSKDGKVLTITAKGKNDQGLPRSNILVFDKQ